MRRTVIVLLVVAAVLTRPASAEDAELGRLREDYARHYFDAKAHLRLAKYLADHGQPLTGFYVSESARRNDFPSEAFAEAVRVVYHDDFFDNSPAAEKRLNDAVLHAPTAANLIALADVYISRSDWKRAEPLLRKAMALQPDSLDPVLPLAEVLRRDGRKAAGDDLERKWLAAHPDSAESWHDRLDPIVDKNPVAAEKDLVDAIQKFPEDASFHFELGSVLQRKGDLPAAAAEMERAAKLGPRSAYIQGWTGRFFLKAMNEPAKALSYYFRAYFLDPDFYDSEYAEGRIRSITTAIGPSGDLAVAEGLRHSDPLTAGYALDAAEKSYKPEYVPPLVSLLAHDDPGLRYGAAQVLAAHGFDKFAELLASPDARVRGAAAYIAGARLKDKVVPLIEPWLESPIDLLRYDAVSVLIEFGGDEGKNALRKWKASGNVKDARLNAILAASLDPPK